MRQDYFDLLIKTLDKTMPSQDVPVSSLIIGSKGEVVSIGWNTRLADYEISDHAEINALNALTTKIKSLNLDQYSLLTTLEPCQMCYGAIKQARIKAVEYIASSDKYGIHNHYSINDLTLKLTKTSSKEQEKIYQTILEKFFKKLRLNDDKN